MGSHFQEQSAIHQSDFFTWNSQDDIMDLLHLSIIHLHFDCILIEEPLKVCVMLNLIF